MLLFWWILLCIFALGGAVALVFYITVELNELEKAMLDLSKELTQKYGNIDEK